MVPALAIFSVYAQLVAFYRPVTVLATKFERFSFWDSSQISQLDSKYSHLYYNQDWDERHHKLKEYLPIGKVQSNLQ